MIGRQAAMPVEVSASAERLVAESDVGSSSSGRQAMAGLDDNLPRDEGFAIAPTARAAAVMLGTSGRYPLRVLPRHHLGDSKGPIRA